MRLWFWPRRKFKPALRTIISPYDLREATEQQRLLMLAGAARSPQDADMLMKYFHVSTAMEVLARLPPPKKRSLKRRWILLMRRIEGHDPTNIYEIKPDNQITVRYRYKRRDS
jgi:hypothetical protein